MSEQPKLGTLLLIGVNHTTAPLDVRERLAIPLARLADATRSLAGQPGIREALILSTCNRVEMLTVVESPNGSEDGTVPATALNFLHQYLNIPTAAVTPHLYTLREREAIRHLFRVASSLDSMVVGEPQILGQVKESWSIAREVGAISSTLDPLLQRAFSVAKRVRTETQIGSSSVSIASVAAELARKIFGSLANKTILLVGAGKMGDLAAKHLIQQGATTLLVSNRTEARAEKIAAAFRTPDISEVPGEHSVSPGVVTTGVIPFAQLHEQTHRADIIITSTGAGQIFSPDNGRTLVHRRRNRPVFFIDIAVPRDVNPAVNNLEGCFVYDIDDLQQVAQENRIQRSREAETAESIVQLEAERYGERLAQAPATEAIKQLQSSAEALREAEFARTAQRLAHLNAPLSPEQLSVIEHLTRSLTNKLLHPQIMNLRGTETKRRDNDD